MANERDQLYVDHIREAVERIESYMQGMEWKVFLDDARTQDAVVRQLEIIGEAAKRLSPEYQAGVNLPWKEITGMRDKLAHDYADVDLEMVWTTVESDLPILKEKLI